jgi:hypothetical protein
MKTKTTKLISFCGLEDWEKQQIKDHELDIAKVLYFGNGSGSYYEYLEEYANDYGEKEAIELVKSVDGITFLDNVEIDSIDDLTALVEAIDEIVKISANLTDFTQKELEAAIENDDYGETKNSIDDTLLDYAHDVYLFDFLAKHNLYDEFIKWYKEQDN